jgi:Ser/Thr protein kinase RdoA (MazF antagonist)
MNLQGHLDDEAREVANRYDAGRRSVTCESLGNRGGLSGSRLWRLRVVPPGAGELVKQPERVGPSEPGPASERDQPGEFCLKRWPATHPTRRQLTWIHARLLLAGSPAEGPLAFVPPPLLTDQGDSLVDWNGHLWELTRWLPGVADFRERPSRARLRSAGHAIAQLHAGLRHADDLRLDIAPGLLRRWQGLQPGQWNDAKIAGWRQATQGDEDAERAHTLGAIVEVLPEWHAACLAELPAALRQPVPLQACVRDLWHAHLLFQGDDLTGIVDYGAMQVDSVCADLTRWLGSCVGAEAEGWIAGLDAYAARRPLTPAEVSILPAFEMASTLLSAVQWLRWTYDEPRSFEDTGLARLRQREILQRLRQGPGTVRELLRQRQV